MIENIKSVASAFYLRGTNNMMSVSDVNPFVASAFYLRGTNNNRTRHKPLDIVASAFYLRGTNNPYDFRFSYRLLHLPSI